MALRLGNTLSNGHSSYQLRNGPETKDSQRRRQLRYCIVNRKDQDQSTSRLSLHWLSERKTANELHVHRIEVKGYRYYSDPLIIEQRYHFYASQTLIRHSQKGQKIQQRDPGQQVHIQLAPNFLVLHISDPRKKRFFSRVHRQDTFTLELLLDGTRHDLYG
jgi:hypothetical protein